MKKGFILAVWVLSLFLTFYVGKWAKTWSQKQAAGEAILTQIQNIFNATTPDKLRQHHQGNGPETAQQIQDRLNNVINSQDFLHGEVLANKYQFIQSLTESELAQTLSVMELDLNDTNGNNNEILMALLLQYAKYNPHDAIRVGEGLSSLAQIRMATLHTVLFSWSQENPQEAYEWWQNNYRDKMIDTAPRAQRNYSENLTILFNGLAQENLYDALDKVGSIENIEDTPIALNGIYDSLYYEDEFNDFLSYTRTLDNPDFTNTYITKLAAREPYMAIAWINTINDPKERQEYQKLIFSGWSQENPQEAYQWHSAHLEGQEKQKAAEAAMLKLSCLTSSKETLFWLEAQKEDIDIQPALQRLLTYNSIKNPAFSAKHIHKLTDEKAKKAISENTYRRLRPINSRMAKKFLEESPYKEELKQKFNIQ